MTEFAEVPQISDQSELPDVPEVPGVPGVPGVSGLITDEELTALALAADPDELLDDSAVPIDVYLAKAPRALPEWYMAPVMARCTGRFGRSVILGLVSTFLLIEAYGLCSTYGQLPFH